MSARDAPPSHSHTPSTPVPSPLLCPLNNIHAHLRSNPGEAAQGVEESGLFIPLLRCGREFNPGVSTLFFVFIALCCCFEYYSHWIHDMWCGGGGGRFKEIVTPKREEEGEEGHEGEYTLLDFSVISAFITVLFLQSYPLSLPFHPSSPLAHCKLFCELCWLGGIGGEVQQIPTL